MERGVQVFVYVLVKQKFVNNLHVLIIASSLAGKMDFSSGSGGNKSSQMDTEKQLRLVQQTVQTEIALKTLSELTDACFKKCIYKPGTYLDNSQKKCLANCMDRYMESKHIMEKVLTTRLQQQQ